MPLALLAASVTGLVAIVLFLGLSDTQQAERREATLKSEIERVKFDQLFLRERGLDSPELDRRLDELRAELAEVQAERRAARQRAQEEAEEIREGLRSAYSSQNDGRE